MAVPDPYAEFLGALRTDTWASRANCIGKSRILEGPDEDAAKALCADCPVTRQCLGLSVKVPSKVDVDGISAGRTKKERDVARRRYIRANKKRPAALTVLAVGDRKPCNQCDEVKPLTEFNIERRTPSGRRGICKTCTRANQRAAGTRPKLAKKEAAA